MARRLLIVAGAGLVAAPLLVWGAAQWLLRDSVLRPRVIAAVEQATGRRLTLGGPVGVKLSLLPTVTLEGVSLANAPGGSRPEMLTARRMEARLALLPLLSRQLAFEHIRLVEPDVLLEVDAAGEGNWRFRPPPPPAADAPGPAPAAQDGRAARPLAFSVSEILIEGGRLTWHDVRGGGHETLEIRDLALTAPEPASPLGLRGQLALRGVEIAVEGTTGPLPRLTGASAEPADWPLELTATSPGLRLQVQGSLSRPEALAGWRLQVEASADRLGRLSPFLPPAQPWPAALEGLAVQASLSDAGPGRPPHLLGLSASLAGGAMAPLAPDLVLGAGSLRFTDGEGPGEASLSGQWRGLTWQGEARLPPLAALAAPGPWPLEATLRAAGLEARLQGALSGTAPLGARGRFEGRGADTAPLLTALGLPGPRLTEAHLATAFDWSGGTALSLEDLRLSSREASLGGTLRWQAGAARPSLRWALSAPRLDLDALLSAPPPQPAAPQPAGGTPAVPPRPPLPAEAGPRRVIPALPLPLARLRGLDAEGPLDIAELRLRGVTYSQIQGHLALEGGQLRIAPLAFSLPGGRLAGSLAADGAAAPPRLSLALRHEGGGLDLRPLLQGYGLPPQGSGLLELEADLQGAGEDLRSLAGTLSGHLALAMANGQIENRLLERLGGELRRLMLPGAPAEAGTALRCLALRLQLRDGIARPQAMLIETGLADVVGSGEIDLGQERLALRLLPQLRLGGLGLTAPVVVGGSFAAPSYRLDSARVPEAAAGILGELMSRQAESGDSVLGRLAQQLADRPAGSLPDCAQQLSVARGGHSGPVPAESPAPSGGRPRAPGPVDILRGLLGR
ncbi:AsmA family protein [Pseudoroseomonas sp. WGS1072]|uniref:AsmA family protein n=1 Tax=Roseomonas sp. WGS1072 TaxID=3366816 RepID=UPI003BEFD806